MSPYEELCDLMDAYEDAYAANRKMELINLAAHIRIQASCLLGEAVENACVEEPKRQLHLVLQ